MKIIAIALNTFRESIRDKVLYIILFFALGIMAFSVTISNLTLGQQFKIILDVGLASMSIFGLLIAVFIGIQLVAKEIGKRTIYVLLSKPVHRWQFIVGKYLGLCLTIAMNIMIMAAILIAILYSVAGYRPPPLFAAAVALILVELMLITAAALFFSTFSTPTLSALFTLGVFVIGHLARDLKIYMAAAGSRLMRVAAATVYYVLPNLDSLDLKNEVAYALEVAPGYVCGAAGYGLVYIAFLLTASVLVFQARDFK